MHYAAQGASERELIIYPDSLHAKGKKKKEFLSDSLGLMSRHSWPCNNDWALAPSCRVFSILIHYVLIMDALL